MLFLLIDLKGGTSQRLLLLLSLGFFLAFLPTIGGWRRIGLKLLITRKGDLFIDSIGAISI